MLQKSKIGNVKVYSFPAVEFPQSWVVPVVPRFTATHCVGTLYRPGGHRKIRWVKCCLLGDGSTSRQNAAFRSQLITSAALHPAPATPFANVMDAQLEKQCHTLGTA